MKKIIGFLVLAIMVILPIKVSAAVESLPLEDLIENKITLLEGNDSYALELERFKDADLSDYEESDDKVNVYLFRSDTCGYCVTMLSFLVSQLPDYEDKINLITYEVTGSADNGNLMTAVGNVFGEDVTGVPYLVIGEETFNGYSDSMDSDILKAIDDEYEASERYDVMDHLGEIPEGSSSGNASGDGSSYSATSNEFIIFLIFFQIVSILSLGLFINYKMNILEIKLKESNKKEESKEKVTTTKKTSVKKK